LGSLEKSKNETDEKVADISRLTRPALNFPKLTQRFSKPSAGLKAELGRKNTPAFLCQETLSRASHSGFYRLTVSPVADFFQLLMGLRF
jgi:hypothetical protein